ncbi:penicillin-binding protein 2, partial [Citrobacter freundii]|nr:penicillin-binding protein 2 [Citrobacter freundii]
KMIPVRLRDHVFSTACAPYKNPKVAVAVSLENGGSEGVTAAPVMRQNMDHLFAPQYKTVHTVTTQPSGPRA